MSAERPETYDIAVIGAGGAGLTAALYGARARRRTVVFERLMSGGQIATTELVENYPGFPQGINGTDFAMNLVQQVDRFGAELRYEDVQSIAPRPDAPFRIETSEATYEAHAVVATAGADYNKLGVPGEDELIGRGVSYCATCDAAFFQNQEAVVVGGGDAAFDEALFTARHVSKVWLVHRRDTFRASALLQERVFANPKIEIIRNTVVDRIVGADGVEGAELRNVQTGEVRTLPVSAVFIFIGQTPNSHLLKGLVELDEGGHARVDLRMRTAVPGLFVAGDLRVEAARQLVSACGDGATAALAAEAYLAEAGIGEG
ncbi:MAG: thioredoxin-disulfide reductase [Dehalococcoidia bacterium]|nr:thioredoxin-disulfide reductase [Dehalococcoidia bacterium]MYD29310.1 thioredoxin-disulfide reductase [Dehalococcoidia bacterium]